MKFDDSLLKWAFIFLGIAFILCIGLIGLLAYVGDRPIPDILVATTTGILGLFGGILIPSGRGTVEIVDENGRHEA